MGDAATRLGGEAAHLFRQYLSRIGESVAPLSDEHVWWRANVRSNSIGNLLLHLEGNLSQWVLAGLGGEPFERHRNAEFAADRSAGATELMARLRDVVERCIAVAAHIPESALARSHSIQGYERDGFGVLLHAVEHMAYHTGQIVLLAKQLAPADVEIEFYPHLKGI